LALKKSVVRFLHTGSRPRANGLPVNWPGRQGFGHIDARKIFKSKAVSYK